MKNVTDNQFNSMVEKHGALFYEQLELEARYKRIAMDSMRNMLSDKKANGAASEVSIGKGLINHQFETVYNNVKTFVDYTLAPKPGVKPAYLGILKDLLELYGDKLDDLYTLLTFLPFSTIINGVFKGETRLSNLSNIIGVELQQEARMEAFLQTHPDVGDKVLTGVSKRVQRHYKTYYAQRMMSHVGFEWAGWNSNDAMHLGAKLIELVIDGSGYFEQYHDTDSKNYYTTTEIRPTQWLLDTWAKNEENVIAKAFKLIPTVIPPAPGKTLRPGDIMGN